MEISMEPFLNKDNLKFYQEFAEQVLALGSSFKVQNQVKKIRFAIPTEARFLLDA